MKFSIKSIICLTILFTVNNISAQSPRNIIVEHFTNTRCGICASSSKNPAFYTNLANFPDVLHISYHPSSPYSNCFLNQHNPTENDGRAYYYNTYGSTPDLIVQGVLNPLSIPFGSADVFSPYLNQNSEVRITIEQTKNTNETMDAIVTITTEMNHNYSGTSLLVGVAEKLVDYSAPNGEKEHHDVFRKSLTAIEGDSFTLPAVGQSKTLNFSIANHEDWNFSEMFFFAILNDDGNKQVIQSQAADPDDNVTSLDENHKKQIIRIYPNPTTENTTITLENHVQATAKIFNLTGNLLLQKNFIGRMKLDLSVFPKSIYFLEITGNGFKTIEKLVVE